MLRGLRAPLDAENLDLRHLARRKEPDSLEASRFEKIRNKHHWRPSGP
jgi:hypothetical protein